MKFVYHIQGCLGFSRSKISDTLIVGVGKNDEDPYVIEKPTLEQAQELLNKSQYLGTGLTATLVAIV